MEPGIILTVVLGGLAVYLLLPRPKPYSPWLGAGLGVAALAFMAMTLIRRAAGSSTVEVILFTSFSTLAVIGAVLLVTLDNAGRGAMAFAVVVLCVSGLFLLQAAPFLMAGMIIIYAGAIIVTFLFVIMLSQQHGQSNANSRSREPLLACLAAALLMFVLLTTLRDHYDTTGLDNVLQRVAKVTEPSQINGTFFSDLRPTVETLRVSATTRRVLCDALDDLEAIVEKKDFSSEQALASLNRFQSHVRQARNEAGDLAPPATLPRSTFAGAVPGGNGEPAKMPSRNVAALGRALFSDYLLAVELGGTLLLVATIGAIAITHRNAAEARA